MHIPITLTCENRHFSTNIIRLIVRDFHKLFLHAEHESVAQIWLSRHNFEGPHKGIYLQRRN
jgi:hypothetical protein